MASKQLGKLRQWAGEVISSRDKTIVSEEFRDLEKDIELRKNGVRRLQVASKAYHHVLVKTRNYEDDEVLDASEKLLPIDALGMVMILHGEEFPDDSAFGCSLVKLGRAHCKIATLQKAYATTFHDTFLASVEKFSEEIKAYEVRRKKLESRRLSYDAAMTKLEKLKNGKKEKDKKEGEEEVQRAKLRYEETAEDVRTRIRAIQENEIDQLRELTAFLDSEMNFVKQHMDVLKNVKSEWCDNSRARKFGVPRADEPLHIFARTSAEFKSNSVRSKASTVSNLSNADDGSSSEDFDHSSPQVSSTRRNSRSAPKASPPSSRSSGKKSDGAGAGASASEKEKEKIGRRLSVAGWASNAVGSVTGRGKKGNKDNFAALMGRDDSKDSDDEDPLASTQTSFLSFTPKKTGTTKSKESLRNPSPKASGRIHKHPPLQDRKIVRALYDFSGASDELSFKAGDEIVVINEVLDEWWMGELDGRKGLFPTSYTETSGSSVTPVLSDWPSSSPSSSEDETSKATLDKGEQIGESDIEDEHLFRADHLIPTSNQFFGHEDVASITSSTAEDAGGGVSLSPIEPDLSQSASDPDFSTPFSPRKQPKVANVVPAPSSASAKKAPPPPPPRRLTTNGLASSPPLPARRPTTSRAVSSPSLAMVSPTSPTNSDASPFESAIDFVGTGCGDFRQNPFKPRGMCSNCFASHV